MVHIRKAGSEEFERVLRFYQANNYKPLKTALVQSAHTVGRSKDTYLAAQYRRIAARRGKKRAAVAVAHSILVIAYHMLKRGTFYTDLGSDYFERRNEQQIKRQLVKRLENLGYKVALETAA